MKPSLTKKQIEWFDKQTDADKRTIALNALDYLQSNGDIHLFEAEDKLLFDCDGEDLRTPF